MKTNIMKTVSKLTLGVLFMATVASYAQVGMGTVTPHASAALEVESTVGGFLPPRLTTAQRNAISSPAEGLTVYNTEYNCLEVYVGYWRNLCAYANASAQEVLSPSTGLIWKDRNLGTNIQVATSSADFNSYGDLYQWGRSADGHEDRGSSVTSTLADNSNLVGGGDWVGLFISAPDAPADWLLTPEDTLWQGTAGKNNPCPTGYRLPTIAEWNAERLSWTSSDAAGAYASPLKLPLSGYRFSSTGGLTSEGSIAGYWSSTVNGVNAETLSLTASSADSSAQPRATGFSVRCLKD